MLVARGKLENRQAIVRIGLQRFVPQIEGVSANAPSLTIPIQDYRALLDTGAQRTCLTHKTIAAEHLVRHGNKFIQNVHSSALHSLFSINLGFWCNGVKEHLEPGSTYYALPEPVEVINIADNGGFDAIIGMDVLRRFDLHFERTGDFELQLN